MDTLSYLEKLYYGGAINRSIFLDYFYEKDRLDIDNILKEDGIIDFKKMDEKLDMDIGRIPNVSLGRIDKIYGKHLDFLLLDLVENRYLLGIKDRSIEADLSRKLDELFLSYKIVVLEAKAYEGLREHQKKLRINKRKKDMSDVVSYVDILLGKAVEFGVSDIHINPRKDLIEVKFRINGVLKLHENLDKRYQSELVTRIKVMSSLDIAEKRAVQDGHFSINHKELGRNFRVAVVPSTYGEKLTIRYLGTSKNIGIGNLIFRRGISKFRKLIDQNNGLILIAGPTGSGKTTTLYAILNYLKDKNKNIMTVEDPIERNLDGVTQVQVNKKVGLGFEEGLKACLRNDIDVIVIGEIRDRETAINAVRASLTGHLVISTIHTKDNLSAIERLVDMGVDKNNLLSSLNGVISQRLIRILCPSCKKTYAIKEYEKTYLGVTDDISIYRPEGCSLCKDGYISREGVFEVLLMDNSSRNYLKNDMNKEDIGELKGENNYIKNQCFKEVIEGRTFIEDLYEMGFDSYEK